MDARPVGSSGLRPRSGGWRWSAALGVALTLIAPTQLAQAAGRRSSAPTTASTVVRVPGHSSDTTEIRLRGASAQGFAVTQGVASQTRVLSGGTGTLTNRGLLDWWPENVTGRVASGYTVNDFRFFVHRMDLLTGTDRTYPSPATPVAYLPDGWLSYGNGTLNRHVAGGASTVLVTGIDSSLDQPVVRADGQGAVIIYDPTVNGDRRRTVGLITFGRAGVTPLWSESATDPYKLQLVEPTLSRDLVAWSTITTFNGGASFIHRRARSGGAITTTRIDGDASPFEIAAAGSAVAMGSLYGRAQISVLDGTTVHTVALPGSTGGIAASGSEFFTAASGKTATAAGVYAIKTTGPARRVARVPRQPAVIAAVSLSAGRLTYSDDAVAGPNHAGSLWQRAATGGSTVSLGPERRLAPVPALAADDGSQVTLSTSAARGVIRRPATTRGQYALLDRGRITHLLPLPAQVLGGAARTSGPYTIVDGQVFRADGRLVRDLRTENVKDADLFGPNLIYSTFDGFVRYRDLARPTARPVTLAGSGICDQFQNCGGDVAIWGGTVAWTALDATISIRPLAGGPVRAVTTGGSVWDLGLSAGALHWTTQRTAGHYRIGLLDLASAGSRPVYVTGLRAIAVDDHLLAGLSETGTSLTVRPLPFGLAARYRPRLIGTLAAAGFTPDGDGRADIWRPQFDVTKPLTGVSLRIYQGSTLVRTLAGTAPDGSVRDLTWNGKTARGTPAAPGTYTYRLTARAKDGSGTLTDGRSPVTGTLTLRR